LGRVGGFDLSFGSYYEDIDLAFRLRWAGYRCAFAPGSRVLHEVSASYDHARPALQRRMSRNAEVLFWTDLPPGWLAAAAVPHLAFTTAQLLWRLARGRARPFLLGKLDALREWRSLAPRRRLRRDLARTGIVPPHFPLKVSPLGDVRNHLRRPRESSARRVTG
jgi:GT2 family glycosyltransferase